MPAAQCRCRRPPPAAARRRPPPRPLLPAASAHPWLQNLVEYISRQRIYDSLYWKQECFGLSAERLVDKAVELKEVRAPVCAAESVALDGRRFGAGLQG